MVVASHSYRPSTVLLFLGLGLILPSVQAQDRAPVPTVAPKARVDDNLPEIYKKWLNEDVRWIISDEERADFKSITGDEQRDVFVVAFWERRNPTPGASQNSFQEEHYRRLAYANTHFAAGVPGWKTDRGRLYIMYGPPDRVDLNPALSPPSEIWHYAFIKGIGRNLAFGFTDNCRCGDYRVTKGDSESSAPRIFDPYNLY